MEFFDGFYQELTDNRILEAMFSHIDAEIHYFHPLRDITDYKSNGDSISISEGFIKSINGNNVPNNTKVVCKPQVDWKYGLTSWFPMKDLNTRNPI